MYSNLVPICMCSSANNVCGTLTGSAEAAGCRQDKPIPCLILSIMFLLWMCRSGLFQYRGDDGIHEVLVTDYRLAMLQHPPRPHLWKWRVRKYETKKGILHGYGPRASSGNPMNLLLNRLSSQNLAQATTSLVADPFVSGYEITFRWVFCIGSPFVCLLGSCNMKDSEGKNVDSQTSFPVYYGELFNVGMFYYVCTLQKKSRILDNYWPARSPSVNQSIN